MQPETSHYPATGIPCTTILTDCVMARSHTRGGFESLSLAISPRLIYGYRYTV